MWSASRRDIITSLVEAVVPVMLRFAASLATIIAGSLKDRERKADRGLARYPRVVQTPDDIELAPFPPLEWDDSFWTGYAKRPRAWQKLRVEREAHLPADSSKTRHGVTVYRKTQRKPTTEQCAAYQSFLDGGHELVPIVLGAIYESYGPMRARWLEQQPELDLPVVRKPLDLARMTKLSKVYVHESVSRGRAYLGLAFRCEWDEEHGAGVMLHGKRVVAVGDHDTAMLRWIAQRDARKRRAAR